MSRERLTAKALTAADPSFGQSANNYWRDKAKDAVLGALSEVERELREEAQRVTDEEAQEIGVQPARYAKSETPVPEAEKEDVRMAALVFEPRKKEAAEEAQVETQEEPRKKEAGAPVDPTAIGKENWYQVQETFPQYSKQQKLTMLAVAPTRRNMDAVGALTDTLDAVASKLEESGDTEGATQLDVISDLLTASVQECQRIVESKKEDQE